MSKPIIMMNVFGTEYGVSGGGAEFEVVPDTEADSGNVGAVLTKNDEEDIVQAVIAALGTPVFGTVDENNVITLTGALVAGTYTVKYEAADGSTADIGTVTV